MTFTYKDFLVTKIKQFEREAEEHMRIVRCERFEHDVRVKMIELMRAELEREAPEGLVKVPV